MEESGQNNKEVMERSINARCASTVGNLLNDVAYIQG